MARRSAASSGVLESLRTGAAVDVSAEPPLATLDPPLAPASDLPVPHCPRMKIRAAVANCDFNCSPPAFEFGARTGSAGCFTSDEPART